LAATLSFDAAITAFLKRKNGDLLFIKGKTGVDAFF